MEYKFGARFKQYRKQNGYTQAQLAVVLGIKQSSISDWENDISRPEYENLIALSKLYDESIDTLLGDEKTIK
jgi:transcriptional regulator with XRE-family HTH domain